MKRRPPLLIVLLLLVAGCGETTLRIPQAAQVTALNVDDNRGLESERRTIHDETTISEFLEFVEAANERGKTQKGDLPDARHRVFLEGNYAAGAYRASVLSGQVIVFLGDDWLAATEVHEYSSSTKVLTLSRDEMTNVHRLLGITQ